MTAMPQARRRSALPAIAVTGVGAIIGQGIVKSLRADPRDTRVIGIDLSDQSPAPRWVDAFEKKPAGVSEDDPAYLDFWTRIVRAHGIALILPGLEIDVAFLDAHRAHFADLGVRLALNTPELIAQTTDKWDFGGLLADIGYTGIPSLLPPECWAQALEQLGPAPLLMKPRRGNGSRGIVTLHDETDYAYWRAKTRAPCLLQRIVGTADSEYTVGVFGLGDGRYLGPLIFQRRLSAAGNTLMARVVPAHPVLEAAVATLCRHFPPLGPTNLQFRLEGGHAYLLEINPRFSSSNSLRTAFGFNEAAMAVDFYLEGTLPQAPVLREGIAWRYTEDFIHHAGTDL
ncbi:ATP-grasp enzyme-like protein [plant metagenome]|uniref:ATP-grasp enzyme-like protein n=1 Tax=plant metagenome TaxID=1297885 RepID=A0A484XA07_9ZZZZ